MIVDEFDVVSVDCFPSGSREPPLAVDANA